MYKPKTLTTTCHEGHPVTWQEGQTPYCEPCDMVGTHLSTAGTGTVYTWTDRQEHEDACADLQDAIDAADDHRYGFDAW